MNAEVDFRHIEENEHLFAYVSSKILDIAEHFLAGQEYHIEVKLGMDRSRTSTRRPHFVSEVIVRLAGHRRAIFIKKSNDDFYLAVRKASHALKRTLRRTSCKANRQRCEVEVDGDTK